MKRRARNIIGLAVLLTLLTSVSIVCLREQKLPFDDKDLKPVRTELDPKDNAFLTLTGAGNRVLWVDDKQVPQIVGMAECRMNWEWDQELAEQLLARNQEVLGLLDQALPPGKLQVPAPIGFDEGYPYLSDWHKIAVLTSIRSGVLYREGREREAFDLAFKLVELGDSIEDSEGAVIHYRRGASIKMMGLSRIRQMTFKTSLPVDYLMHLSKSLSGYRANAKALTNALRTDYQVNAALVQDLSAGKFPGTNAADPFIRALGMPMFSVEKTKHAFAQSARVGIESIPHSYAAMPVEKFPPATTNSGAATQAAKIVRGNAFGELVFELMHTSPKRLLTRKCEENVAVSATEAVLALKCYGMRHGALPESLSDLVPAYLATVPVDDFDGKSFRYSREKKLIYSVGWNLTDDGGQERNAQKERLDIVFKLEF